MADEDKLPRYNHPAIDGIMQWFSYEHLPPDLQEVSRLAHELAHKMAQSLQGGGPELTVGLRKLLEAKDCFVRAAKHKGQPGLSES